MIEDKILNPFVSDGEEETPEAVPEAAPEETPEEGSETVSLGEDETSAEEETPTEEASE